MSDVRCPVFLIGAGRSGTKFLRSCLSASNQVDSIPYDINYVWRYGNESKSDDEFTPADLSAEIKEYIIKTLPKLSATNKPQAKFLVEKSVPNTLRVSFLNKAYPEAKFINITRNGRAVVESSIRQWKQPTKKSYLMKKMRYFPWGNYRYAIWFLKNVLKSKISSEPSIWGPRYKGITEDITQLLLEEVAAKQWSRCVDVAENQLSRIESNRVLNITFEDFMNDPKVIDKLCDFIGIADVNNVSLYFQENVDRTINEKSFRNLSTTTSKAIDRYASESLKRLGYQ